MQQLFKEGYTPRKINCTTVGKLICSWTISLICHNNANGYLIYDLPAMEKKIAMNMPQ